MAFFGKKWKILEGARVRRKSPYRYADRENGPKAFADGPASPTFIIPQTAGFVNRHFAQK